VRSHDVLSDEAQGITPARRRDRKNFGFCGGVCGRAGTWESASWTGVFSWKVVFKGNRKSSCCAAAHTGMKTPVLPDDRINFLLAHAVC